MADVWVARRGSDPRLLGNGTLFLVLDERLEDALSHLVRCDDVGDRPQEREAPSLGVDGVLACREGDVSPVADASISFPDAEANELQAGQRALVEMQLGIGEFAHWAVRHVGDDPDGHDGLSFFVSWSAGGAPS